VFYLKKKNIFSYKINLIFIEIWSNGIHLLEKKIKSYRSMMKKLTFQAFKAIFQKGLQDFFGNKCQWMQEEF